MTSSKKYVSENLELSNTLFHTCIGVLLGDASIQKNTSKSKEKYRLKFLQSVKHKSYIYHLHKQFNDYVISDVFFNEKRNTYSFQTVFHSEFKKLADIFLNLEKKKTITTYFEKNIIFEISLAYWFMDDGGLLSYNKDYKRKGLVLNTQGFSFNEVKILSENLNKNYNLETWVKENKKKPIIAVSGKKYTEIEKLISPYIIDSMKYKLPL